MSLINVTSETFDREVLESKETIIIDFHATWCGPCKMLAPILDQVAEENPNVKICKIDVDQSPALAQKYSVMSVPTLVFIKDGETKKVVSGMQSKNYINDMIKA